MQAPRIRAVLVCLGKASGKCAGQVGGSQTCEYVMLFWFLKASKYFFPIAPPMSFHAPCECLEEPSAPVSCPAFPAKHAWIFSDQKPSQLHCDKPLQQGTSSRSVSWISHEA